MSENAVYSAQTACKEFDKQTDITIEDGLLHFNGGEMTLDLADISDMRLIDYAVYIKTYFDEIKISMLGLNTENFFDNLWNAYNDKTVTALFSGENSKLVLSAEGEYSYLDKSGSAHGKAKLMLYGDNMTLLPHDDGARRIPLCFVKSVGIKEFTVSVTLDTNEQYMMSKMGSDTDAFFTLIKQNAKQSIENRQKRLSELMSSGSIVSEKYLTLSKLFNPEEILTGYMHPDSADFFMSIVKNGRAFVEIESGEATATYLYSFNTQREDFIAALMHAMEAVGMHRELIYLDEALFNENPLYRMARKRSYHIGFLRSCSCGRAIHNEAWEKEIVDFFS